MRMELALGLAVVALCLLCRQARAVTPTADELATARQWTAVKFTGQPESEPGQPGLDVIANHDPVQKLGKNGTGLRIGGEAYARGLFCHAVSKVRVRLPGPGKTFTGVVGVDTNEQTAPARGSIEFAVRVGDTEAFHSEVMREGMPGVPVEVDLGGATEFVIEVGDAGDGIACDQANWADAKVVLADGATVWLDDLPMAQSPVLLEPDSLPFSFVYGGQSSAALLNSWDVERISEVLDANRTQHTLTFADPDTGLVVRCVAIEYHDFPTVEWTLYFANTGTTATPILESIQALDIGLERADPGEFLLHHFNGSACGASDYAPRETALGADAAQRIASAGGRGSNGAWPYFNVESTCRDGAIVVVGWPGQWAAEFTRDKAKGLRLKAGQELTHFKLLPGEEVRTPLVVVQFWNGDWVRAQNVWRRWMMAHSMPKPGGALPKPMVLASSSRAYAEMIEADEQKQIMFIDRYLEEGIQLDYWWMDAGWYIQEHGWPQVGTWEVDPARFPSGFKPISDHAHAHGIKILVWFEPERVAGGTWLTQNHPEWILGGANGGLLNLGNPEAWDWLLNHVDTLLTEQGIDLYRQDFNMDPLGHWRGNDPEDRQGITEIKHVTGYLAYWDELRRRHPNMLIDSCASGGRRNDLETMRRAVPLWRSDYAYEPTGHQCMTYGISFWLPFHGTGTVACIDAPYYGAGATPVEPYAFWSTVSGIDLRVKELDYDALRKLFGQLRQVGKYYYGDYYPLTPYGMGNDVWLAWQFHCPETGEGMVQAFRRPDSIYVSAALPLKGLDADAQYALTDLATSERIEKTGKQLIEEGLPLSIPQRPGAVVIAYKQL